MNYVTSMEEGGICFYWVCLYVSQITQKSCELILIKFLQGRAWTRRNQVIKIWWKIDDSGLNSLNITKTVMDTATALLGNPTRGIHRHHFQRHGFIRNPDLRIIGIIHDRLSLLEKELLSSSHSRRNNRSMLCNTLMKLHCNSVVSVLIA